MLALTVLFENMLFNDWRTSEKNGQWTDVFMLRISPFAGLPPVEYAVGLYRLASLLIRKRPSASLWVQVDGPGNWYRETLRSVLRWKGKLPIAVSGPSSLSTPDRFDYIVLPFLEDKRPPEVKRVKEEMAALSKQALLCLQVLARIDCGTLEEMASLALLYPGNIQSVLGELVREGLVSCDEERNKKDTVIRWRIQRDGLSLALRSWGIPKEIPFARRKEMAFSDPEGDHRRISRLWPKWLITAWPHIQVWSGWSEVSLPGLPQTPDGLAWGMMNGLETLFWLEVESGHSSREEVRKKIRRRFVHAAEYAKEQNVCLVFALLGREWVCEAARPAFVGIPPHVAVTIGDWKEKDWLPMTELGRAEW